MGRQAEIHCLLFLADSGGQPLRQASIATASTITFLIMPRPLVPCKSPSIAAQEKERFSKCQTGSLSGTISLLKIQA